MRDSLIFKTGSRWFHQFFNEHDKTRKLPDRQKLGLDLIALSYFLPFFYLEKNCRKNNKKLISQN